MGDGGRAGVGEVTREEAERALDLEGTDDGIWIWLVCEYGRVDGCIRLCLESLLIRPYLHRDGEFVDDLMAYSSVNTSHHANATCHMPPSDPPGHTILTRQTIHTHK